MTSRRVRRILGLAGYRISLGRPGAKDLIGVWGQSPTSHRGEAMATRSGARIVRIEDAWLRSLFPGRRGDAPTGLLIDHSGVHFDPAHPSDLETLLATHPLDDSALLARARGAMARMIEAGLTKYTATDSTHPLPPPGYVLVIDQTKGDAAVTASRADRNRFLEMLFVAQEEHPGARIIIKTHPETAQGLRAGHFTAQDHAPDHITLLDTPVPPWALLDSAIAVYTVSSQLGFEAILAGHKPRVFGQPFYAGWGLTQDETPVDRRQRRLTRAQLFAAAMILYPKWYDPARDQLCSYEEAAEQLAAETRAWREDRHGWVASGMRRWKRGHLQQFFGQHKPVVFEDDPTKAAARCAQSGAKRMVWANKTDETEEVARLEDGFLRSQGLGAALIPPLSLALDDLGIYYDPARASRLEEMIRARSRLRPDQQLRAETLQRELIRAGLTKYNQGGALPSLPEGHRILVPGQVADDASILKGAGLIADNAVLLRTVRQANPDAVIVYKPHPDVDAGLRPGAIDALDADVILGTVDPALALHAVQEVWTMTSLLGFEALLRGCAVTTLGAPFYAGWGLTQDLGDVPPRRRGDVTLAGLIHATLIDYPRYLDPISGLPCPVETVLTRLRDGTRPRLGPTHRALSHLQGLFASYAHLWR